MARSMPSKKSIKVFFYHSRIGKHRKKCEKLPWELVSCQGVFTKRCHYNYFCHYCYLYYYHNLSFWVWSQINLSSFVTIFFCCLITVWVLVFCHMSFFSRTKWWSLSVEGLLSTGPTPSSLLSVLLFHNNPCPWYETLDPSSSRALVCL